MLKIGKEDLWARDILHQYIKMQKEEKIGQEQFHSFVFGEKLSWKEIIYDLINSEQLDPWDIDLAIVSQKYIEKIRELEEANFILSSKVLLVASLMLRIKSELLINYYIKSLDDILFNKKKEEIQHKLEIEEFDEDEIPSLIPRTPLPRFRKVNLNELIMALNRAVKTETRREFKRKEEKDSYERAKFFLPRQTINISQRIKIINQRVKDIFSKQEKIPFSEFAGPKKQDKIDYFVPLLHLDTRNKLWLQQEKHLDEIWIHKNGEKFIQRDEIITSSIEEEFEEELIKDKITS